MRDYIRLCHPETGKFIAEYYPLDNKLRVTHKGVDCVIWLDSLREEWLNERNEIVVIDVGGI